jgi:hypothetical protein
VFTARYALSPSIKQIRFVFKGLIFIIYRYPPCTSDRALQTHIKLYCAGHTHCGGGRSLLALFRTPRLDWGEMLVSRCCQSARSSERDLSAIRILSSKPNQYLMWWDQLWQNLVCTRATRNSVQKKLRTNQYTKCCVSGFNCLFFYTSYAIQNYL